MGGWRAGLDAGAAVAYEAGGSEAADYLQIVATTLAKVLPGDVVAWNALDLCTGEIFVSAFPRQPWPDQTLAQQLADVLDDHPMATSYFGDPHDIAPRRMSDVVARADFLRTRAYNDLYRLMEADQQITIVTSSALTGRLHCWAVNRLGADFTDDEVAIAAAIQPTLSALERSVFRHAGARFADVHDIARQPFDPGAAERHGLTRRELQVLWALADGLTADSIGRLLRISPATARKHLEHTYAKLGCHDRLLATRKAAALGLLTD